MLTSSSYMRVNLRLKDIGKLHQCVTNKYIAVILSLLSVNYIFFIKLTCILKTVKMSIILAHFPLNA